MRTLKTLAAAAALLALTGAAQAALVSLGDGTVKDTDTNLIWLQDWNVNGFRNWATQMAWAQGLTFAGSSDWVLPSINEFATLFGEAGDLTLVSAFTNVQPDRYWSSQSFFPGDFAYSFSAALGSPGFDFADKDLFFGVAVRPADVDAPVPDPQTLALALLALGATVVARRRRSR